MTVICLSTLSIIKISARSWNQSFFVYFIRRVDLCSRFPGPIDSIFCSNSFFYLLRYVVVYQVSIKDSLIRSHLKMSFHLYDAFFTRTSAYFCAIFRSFISILCGLRTPQSGCPRST
ncbi:unnamed protein product [Albugo candida]|uniref:Uncharacterized protein n=1 Tax=Albugo candida TaxID=65357 RepID=A0A024GUQ0_9STRA|nr:unnamed protein product [Albugo candida]|eukprot:CCI50097.1 unnamed protein product [Albugo candida]